jgi:Sulfotransferase family
MSLERFFRYPATTANYLANISERFQFCYINNPKCASTGILHALQTAEADGDAARIPDFVHDRALSPLLNFENCTGSPEDVLTKFFVFSYVRNPYSRVLSAYIDKIEQEEPERVRLLPTLGLDPGAKPSFLEFLRAIQAQRDDWRDIHWTTQSRLLQTNNIAYSFIGRFESFSASFPAVLDRLGVSRSHFDVSYVPRHVTRANERIAEYIGPKERDLIASIYYADFINFAYGLDPHVAYV